MIFTVSVKNHPAFVVMPFSKGLNISPNISLKNIENITNPIINPADVKNTTGCMSNLFFFSLILSFSSKLIEILLNYLKKHDKTKPGVVIPGICLNLYLFIY